MKSKDLYGSVLKKMASLCSRQEKCVFDIRQKLQNTELSSEDKDSIIKQLIKNGFIDEQRFTENFTSEKLKLYGWGKVKIYEALNNKGIPEETIIKTLKSIDELEYKTLLSRILLKKNKEIKANESDRICQKLFQFALGRGFEKELIELVIHDLVEENE